MAPVEVVLFVSRARGDRHIESGIDLMVIADDPTPEPRSGLGVCWQEEQRLCFKPEAPGLGSTIVPVPVGCRLLHALEDHSLLPDGLALGVLRGRDAANMNTADSMAVAPPASTGLGKRRTQLIHRIVAYGVLGTGSLFILAPLVWMLSTSLKTRSQVFRFPPEWIPEQFPLAKLCGSADPAAL